MRFNFSIIAICFVLSCLPFSSYALEGMNDDISLDWLLGEEFKSPEKIKKEQEQKEKEQKEKEKEKQEKIKKEQEKEPQTKNEATANSNTKNTTKTQKKVAPVKQPVQNKKTYSNIGFLNKVRKGLPFEQDELENWIMTTPNINTCYENGQTMLLYILTRYRNAQAVVSLIENGADIQTHCTPRYESLFIAAINNPSANVLETLLNNGANIVERDSEKNTALMLAAAFNPSAKVLNTLIDYGVKINAVNNFGYDALMLAAYQNKNYKVIETLLDNEANVNFRDPDGHTPLMAAAIRGRDEIMKYLINRGADFKATDKTNMSVLDYYRKRIYLETEHFSVEGMPTPSERMQQEFNFINKYHHHYNKMLKEGIFGPNAFADVSTALKNFADQDTLDDKNCTPLINAFYNNNSVDVIKKLLEYKADANAKCDFGKTPLIYLSMNASSKNDINEQITKAKLLLQYGANINQTDNNGNTPLMYATGFDADKKFIEFLLQNQADVNKTNQAKENPLWLILKKQGNADILKTLIEYGADVNFTNNHGETPLWYQLRTKANKDLTVTLLRGNADADTPNATGDTPIWYAFYHQADEEILETIAQFQKNANIKNRAGDTPLLYAVKHEYPTSLIKALLDNGANPKITDKNGYTIYDILKNNQFFNETVHKINRNQVIENW